MASLSNDRYRPKEQLMITSRNFLAQMLI